MDDFALGETTVSAASRLERAAALELVFRRWSAESRARQIEQLEEAEARGESVWPHIWVARRGDVLAGAAAAHVRAGGTAVVWPAQLAAGLPAEMGRALVAACVASVRLREARTAQCLLDSDVGDEAQQVRGAGFERLTDLLYLVWTVDGAPAAGESQCSQLELVRCGPEQQLRLAGIVGQTYVGTRDCPQLNEVCDAASALAEYGGGCENQAERPWYIARHGGKDVGCLLLADHADEDLCEVVYMGVVPAMRGRGWGGMLTRHAQRIAAARGRKRLALAVDVENAPALRVYFEHGFSVWARRSVFWQDLRLMQASGAKRNCAGLPPGA